jgi:hypothetical protein
LQHLYITLADKASLEWTRMVVGIASYQQCEIVDIVVT